MSQSGSLTRHAGATPYTTFKSLGSPISRTPMSRSGGRPPRPNPGRARNQASGNSGPTATVRRLVLERDGYCCVCCGHSIIGRRYSLGHRLRASQGGKAVPSNLLTLLGWGGQDHHGRIDDRRDPADEAKGYTIRSGGSPLLVPVMFFEPSGRGALVYLRDDGTVSAEPPGSDAA